jgi:YhcH/YjgK/YiaL family protein
MTMIYDKINNIETYAAISEDIRVGLEYLREVRMDIAVGSYQINPRVKAIVSEYETKIVNEFGYEAHRDYIDIQYLISGKEIINSLPLEYLKEIKPYNKEIDAAFYEEVKVKPQELLLGNGYFAILFPQDGHMPQLSVNMPMKVKKVVIKVKLGE